MNYYPSDEDIARLIEELEAQPLHAPPHLKAEVLARLGDGAAKKRGGQALRTSLYNLKIIAGVAAALFLLFLMPEQMAVPEWPSWDCQWSAVALGRPGFPPHGTGNDGSLRSAFLAGQATLREGSNAVLSRINDFGTDAVRSIDTWPWGGE